MKLSTVCMAALAGALALPACVTGNGAAKSASSSSTSSTPAGPPPPVGPIHWGETNPPPGTLAPPSPRTYAAKPAIKIPQGFIIGADISWVQAAEEGRGGRRAGTPLRYKDNGVEKDILQILKDHGFNYARLRVFVEPANRGGYSAQGYCDLPHTIAFAKRVKAAGMGLLIDFHYSDTWADPQHQIKPLAWQQLPFDALVKTVHDYTKDAVAQMVAAGAAPDMVQIGNEITPGMIMNRPTTPGRDGGPAPAVSTQPDGSIENFDQLAALLKAGISGAKEADPRVLIMLHIDRGGDNPSTVSWVDAALARGVQFDILGLSSYTRYHGPKEGWKANYEDLVKRYPNLSFIAAEYTDEKRYVNEMMFNLPGSKGLGTFIWEPTQYGERVFDAQGNTLPLITTYDAIKKDFGRGGK